jgi:hypothetical protein
LPSPHPNPNHNPNHNFNNFNNFNIHKNKTLLPPFQYHQQAACHPASRKP